MNPRPVAARRAGRTALASVMVAGGLLVPTALASAQPPPGSTPAPTGAANGSNQVGQGDPGCGTSQRLPRGGPAGQHQRQAGANAAPGSTQGRGQRRRETLNALAEALGTTPDAVRAAGKAARQAVDPELDGRDRRDAFVEALAKELGVRTDELRTALRQARRAGVTVR